VNCLFNAGASTRRLKRSSGNHNWLPRKGTVTGTFYSEQDKEQSLKVFVRWRCSFYSWKVLRVVSSLAVSSFLHDDNYDQVWVLLICICECSTSIASTCLLATGSRLGVVLAKLPDLEELLLLRRGVRPRHPRYTWPARRIRRPP
jgi:hypothetical protein